MQKKQNRSRPSLLQSNIPATIAPAGLSPEIMKKELPANKWSNNFNSIPMYPRAATLQAKLSVNKPGDKYEQEADAMANKIMHQPATIDKDSKAASRNITPVIQTKTDAAATGISTALSNEISSSRGTGSNMDKKTQSCMSGSFGVDFSKVRIHDDEKASAMNRQLNAKAFTVGSDIYFNSGEYQPGQAKGKELLAHELTHTIQQGKGPANNIQMQPGDEEEERLVLPTPSLSVPSFQPSYRTTAPASSPALTISPQMAVSLGSAMLDEFPLNRSTLTATHRSRLNLLAQTISAVQKQYEIRLSIVGHADATGSESHNQNLGQLRAETVRFELARLGIPLPTMDASSEGESNLRVATESTEPANRRVEISLQVIRPLSAAGTSAAAMPPRRIDLTPHLRPPTEQEEFNERMQRMLRLPADLTPPRTQIPSVNDALHRLASGILTPIMSGLHIPESWRPHIIDAAAGGIEKGISAGFEHALDEAGITGPEREALIRTFEGLRKTHLDEGSKPK